MGIHHAGLDEYYQIKNRPNFSSRPEDSRRGLGPINYDVYQDYQGLPDPYYSRRPENFRIGQANASSFGIHQKVRWIYVLPGFAGRPEDWPMFSNYYGGVSILRHGKSAVTTKMFVW